LPDGPQDTRQTIHLQREADKKSLLRRRLKQSF